MSDQDWLNFTPNAETLAKWKAEEEAEDYISDEREDAVEPRDDDWEPDYEDMMLNRHMSRRWVGDRL